MTKIKTQKFMFFDDLPYEYARGFSRIQGRPVKYIGNPFLSPEKPHEFARTSMYGTVIFNQIQGKYMMWYPTFGGGDKPIAYLCHAESSDGLKWVKPDAGIVPGTNIVLDETHDVRGQSIILDMNEENPERRYKFLVRPGRIPRVCSYVSPDGIHWKILSDSAIAADSDSHIGLMRYPETGMYMATMRKVKGDRRVWLSTSNDFETWTDPVLVMEPGPGQSMQTQIYGMQISYYGAYIIGEVSYYNTFEDDLDGWGKMDGSMDIGLAYSRGGYCWHEAFPYERFIETGGNGQWDSGMIMPSSTPVYLEDEIRFYYSGMNFLHKPPYSSDVSQRIGMAALRPDGFVYMEAGKKPAELLTRRFAIEKPGFMMNADASKGEIRIGICDGDGHQIKGFEIENSVPVTTDGLRIQLEWKNEPKMDALINTSLRFKVKARDARLYSITMINGEEAPDYRKFREIDYADPLFRGGIYA
ncbi:MAG: hypothetical protein R6W99_10040 [Clostridia bacterium]